MVRIELWYVMRWWQSELNIEELLFSSLDLITCILKMQENELYLGKVVSNLFKVTIEFRCGPLSDSLSV